MKNKITNGIGISVLLALTILITYTVSDKSLLTTYLVAIMTPIALVVLVWIDESLRSTEKATDKPHTKSYLDNDNFHVRDYPDDLVPASYIIEWVCDHFDITEEELSIRNKRRYSSIRTLTAHLLRDMTNLTFDEISTIFGLHTSTVIKNYGSRSKAVGYENVLKMKQQIIDDYKKK